MEYATANDKLVRGHTLGSYKGKTPQKNNQMLIAIAAYSLALAAPCMGRGHRRQGDPDPGDQGSRHGRDGALQGQDLRLGEGHPLSICLQSNR